MLISYYLFRMLFKNSLSASFYYLMLKISLFLYLFPLPLFTRTIRQLIRDITGNQNFLVRDFSKVTPVDTNKILFVTDKGFYVAPTLTLTFRILIGTWLLIIFIVLLIHIYQYRRLQRLIQKNTKLTKKYNLEAIDTQYFFHIRKNIDIRILNQKQTPFSCGLIKPSIVLPENLDEEESSLIIQHELTHIKSHDPLIRIICLLAVAIHFFNPFVYLLFWEITKISELHCDERVIKKMNNTQKTKQYGHLILNMTHYSVKSPFLTPFVHSDQKVMKERITMIKFPAKNKLHIALPALIISILASTVPVLAYNPPEISEYDKEYVDGLIEADMSWNEPYDGLDYPEDEEYFKQVDSYFIDEQGQIILDNTQDAIESRTCSHKISTYRHKQHNKKSSGGCTVKEWKIHGCTKCDYTISKELISTTKYKSCPHK